MAQLTAVEWFLKELIRCGWLEEGQINITLEQAKKMEKEQIKKAYKDYHDLGHIYGLETELYYNETYGENKD